MLGQTNWAENFGGIWGIFDQTISTHFGTVSHLSMFSIIQPLFLQIFFGDWDLNLDHKELGIVSVVCGRVHGTYKSSFSEGVN